MLSERPDSVLPGPPHGQAMQHASVFRLGQVKWVSLTASCTAGEATHMRSFPLEGDIMG